MDGISDARSSFLTYIGAAWPLSAHLTYAALEVFMAKLAFHLWSSSPCSARTGPLNIPLTKIGIL
jgi:hypothetical protein